MKNGTVGALALRAALVCAFTPYIAAHANPVYTTFDPVGSVSTYVKSIAAGTIAGDYSDGTTSHGFLRAADGTITTFDPPGATSTYVAAVNASGVVVGQYTDSNSNTHGFTRALNGTVTLIDYPGAPGSYPDAINGNGVVAGQYEDSNFDFHFFVGDAGGTFTSFDVIANQTALAIAGINDAGTIAGIYAISSQQPVSHAFVRTADGTVTPFDVQASSFTVATGIDGAGRITGSYGFNGHTRGYRRSVGGTFATFSHGVQHLTVPKAISRGEIVGVFRNSHLGYYSFDRATDGTLTAFHVAGSTSTVATSIWHGDIAGYFTDGSGANHGFLRTP